jgi:hypothetical protein
LLVAEGPASQAASPRARAPAPIKKTTLVFIFIVSQSITQLLRSRTKKEHIWAFV